MHALRGILFHQGQVRADKLPLLIGHVGRVNFAVAHRLLYSSQS